MARTIVPRPYRIHDLTGMRFGRLRVLGLSHRDKHGQLHWRCVCDCETDQIIHIHGQRLRDGITDSCGCLKSERCREVATRHGHAAMHKRSSEYYSWAQMIQRCYNENHSRYQDYGGRGITVCARWLKFENFFADMGRRPPGANGMRTAYSIDRYPDNDGNYEPNNVRWATWKQQANNRRNTVTTQNKDYPE